MYYLPLNKKNIQRKLSSHKKLAQERTLLANKRTFLAYIRTGLAFFALGAGLVGLLEEHIIFVYGGYGSLLFGILFIGNKCRLLHSRTIMEKFDNCVTK